MALPLPGVLCSWETGILSGTPEAALRNAPVTLGSESFLSREVGGLLVTEAYFPPGQVLPVHRHQRPTVAVMLEGSFDCTFPRRALPCLPGTLHSEPAEERHGNRMGKLGAHVVVIQPAAPATETLGRAGKVLERINHIPQSLATGLAWRLAREVHHSDVAAPLAIEGLALEILSTVVRYTDRSTWLRPPPAWLRRAQEYLYAHFRRSFRIADLAREVDVSPLRLARAFRRSHGVTIARYVRQLRLEWAGLELTNSDQPLSRIASQAGFADQSHFTRAFRAHVGWTPARFRERTRACERRLPLDESSRGITPDP